MAEKASHSTLRSPTRTSYYNSFFLYKTDVVLNGQPAEIGCSDKGELSLSCRRSCNSKEGRTLPSISFPSISARVEEILQKYGVFEVVSFFCEDSPLFQVTFSSDHSLKQFVQSRGRMEKELAGLFSKMLQPTLQAGAPANVIPAQVNSKLFLMTPDWFGRRCGSMEVTLDNFADCMFVWKNSEVFEFGVVLSQQKGVYTGSIRKSKGTRTSDLRRSQDKGTNTSTSGLRLSKDESTSMIDLTQSKNEGTCTGDLRLPQDKGTSTSDLRLPQDKGTSSSDLRLPQDKGTSTSDLRLPQDKGTSTGDLRLPQDKGTSTGDLRLPQDKGTSTGDLRLPQDKGTSTGDLRLPQDKGTSTSDLRLPQDKATSMSELRLPQDKGTSTGDLRLPQDKGTSTSDLRLPQDKGTSTGDLRLPQDKGTSTGDLRLPQDKGTSTGDLRLPQDKATSMSDLTALQSNSSSSSDPKAEADQSTDAEELQEKDVGSVLQWLEKVFEWFFLATHLDIPHHELKIIEQNHPKNVKQCKVEMVHTWIKLGGASWSALVRALWEIGRRTLAKKLADKFEITLPATDSDQRESSVQCELLTDISENDQRLEDTTATLVLAEEQRSQALKDISQATMQLKESISKLPKLEQDKEQLTSQLRETRDALQTLEGRWCEQKEETHAVRVLKQETVRLQEQVHQKDEEIAMIMAEVKDLRHKLQDTAEKLETASNELNKLKSEQDLLKFELERKRREVEIEQNRLVFKDETIKDLKEELKEMRAEETSKLKEIGALGERLSSQSEEVDRLRMELHEAVQRKPALPNQPSGTATVQQELFHTMETSDLRVKLATAEAGRQEVERQLGALQRQVLFLQDEQVGVIQLSSSSMRYLDSFYPKLSAVRPKPVPRPRHQEIPKPAVVRVRNEPIYERIQIRSPRKSRLNQAEPIYENVQIRSPRKSRLNQAEPIYENVQIRSPGKSRLNKADKEPIPITVDLVGSNHGLKNEFFKLLSVECSYLLSPQDSPQHLSTVTPLDVMQRPFSLAVARKDRYPMMQFDDCVNRAEIPSDCFDSEVIFPPQFIEAGDATTPTVEDPRPRFKQLMEIGKKHFIIQLLNYDIKEQFVHLFLRSSGVYLLLVDLQDVLDDPMIQYGNITQWLHLLHAYLTPDYAKRVIIVGTYRRSQVKEVEILKLVKLLSAAIANTTNQVYRIPFKGEGYVFMFDLENLQQDAICLCACVERCIEIIYESTYYKQDGTRQGQFFSNAFEPFLNLGSLCANLSSMAADGKVIATAKEIRQAFSTILCYRHLPLPENYLESLSIYSSGLISTNPASGSVLNPGFIIKILEKMELASDMYIPQRCVQQLPVVSKAFVEQQMDMQKLTDWEDRNTVLEWMKKMDLIIEVGASIYFIPVLTMPVASNPTWKWSEEEEEKFEENNTTVLFSKLRFLATPHFLHSLIAVLIQEILRYQHSYPSCFINLGCSEAILPLCAFHRVLTPLLLRYHETANFIEFRAPKSVPKRQLLDAIQTKLEAAHGKSHFSSIPFKDAIAFHTPALTHDRTIVEGPIWQLACVKITEREWDEYDSNNPRSVLPKTKYLAAPGDFNTKELQEWVRTTSPQDKELPPNLLKELELRLGSQDSYWEGVAAQLHLLTVDEINLLRNIPPRRGNGCEVMARWKESNCSFEDLEAALRVVGLNSIAMRVRKLHAHETDV